MSLKTNPSKNKEKIAGQREFQKVLFQEIKKKMDLRQRLEKVKG